jgi:Secretion system C-terminal sorting domain
MLRLKTRLQLEAGIEVLMNCHKSFRSNIKFILILLLFLFLDNSSALALSWTRGPEGPAQNITCFDADSSEQRMILGTFTGGFWLSEDGGSSWEGINTRILDNPPYGIYVTEDAWFLDPGGDTLVVKATMYPNQNWQYAISTDGGQSWTQINPGTPNQSNHSHVFTIDRSNHSRFLHAHMGDVSVSEDFGETWSSVLLPGTMRNQRLSIYQDTENDTTFFMTGLTFSSGRGGGVVRTRDYGASWDLLVNPETVLGDQFCSIPNMLRSENGELMAPVFMAGYFDTISTLHSVPGILVSQDEGESWVLRGEGLPRDIFASELVEAPDSSGTLFFAGIQSIENRNLYFSNDAGSTFTPCETSPAWDLSNMSNLSVNRWSHAIYASTFGQGVFRSDNGGTTWTPISLPEGLGSVGYISGVGDRLTFDSSRSLRHMVMNPDTDEWLITEPVEWNDSTYFYPHQLLSAEGAFFTSIGGMYRRDSLIATDPHELGIYRSVDSGQNWSRYGTTVEGQPRLAFSDTYSSNSLMRIALESYQNGSWFLNVSVDTGLTWQSTMLENHNWDCAYGIAQSDTAIFFASALFGVRKSLDNGQSWTDLAFPATQDIGFAPLIEINENNGDVYLFTQTRVYRYDGTAWTQTGHSNSMEKVACIPGDPPIFVGSQLRTVPYISWDECDTWTPIQADIPYGDQFSIIGSILHDTERNRIWMTTGVGLMSIDVDSLQSLGVEEGAALPSGYETLTSWPNPFNQRTSVVVRIEQPAKASLRLYDLLGREVRELITETLQPGLRRLSLDGSGLASGTYFLHLELDGRPATTKRIVLLK